MAEPLRVLIVEDSEDDTLLLLHELRRGGYDPTHRRVETREAMAAALAEACWDAILSDYRMPHFSGLAALALVQELQIDLPFIIVSGTIGEEIAVAAMKAGAHDYLMKGSLARLGPVIERERRETRVRRERAEAETALTQERNLLRTLIENIPDKVNIKDAQSRYVLNNPAHLRTLGAARQEDVLGKTSFDFFPPQAAAQYRADEQEILRSGEPLLDREELAFDHSTGETRWHLTNKVPLRDAEGRIVGLVGVARDITERKRAEAERVALEEQLRQAQKMESIGRLAGGVAHDFNNLLSPILGYAELLLMDLASGDPRVDELTQIRDAAVRARDLTRQLLAFSRKQILSLASVDLRSVVGGFEKLLRRTLREDIQIVIQLPPELGTVCADVGQVEQVLMNLAVNAQDAMPDGGTLTFAIRHVRANEERSTVHAAQTPHPLGLPSPRPLEPPHLGEFAEISVTDTGDGMDAATQSRLFEPFFTTKELGRGTGLGLSTVYGIVTQHGGHLRVNSAPGRGTTFAICLPVVEAPPAAAPPPAAGETALLRGTETVLVVEDNPAVREMACQVLERHGYRVLTAENGPQALTMIETHRAGIDLLLTDVVMPGMNGRLLRDRLSAGRSGARVLYMSGYTADVIANHGVVEEGVAFIQKPFAVQALLQKVREALDCAPPCVE